MKRLSTTRQGHKQRDRVRTPPFLSSRDSPSPLPTAWQSTEAPLPVCPSAVERGRGDDSTPFFPDKKTETHSPGVGTEAKKECKRPPKRLPEVTHNPSRVPWPAPYLHQPFPTGRLCYRNSPPALLSASVSSMHPGKCSLFLVTCPMHEPTLRP